MSKAPVDKVPVAPESILLDPAVEALPPAPEIVRRTLLGKTWTHILSLPPDTGMAMSEDLGQDGPKETKCLMAWMPSHPRE